MNLTDLEIFVLVLGWAVLMVLFGVLMGALTDMRQNRKGKHCPYCGERH